MMNPKCQVEGHSSFSVKGFCIEKDCTHRRTFCLQKCHQTNHLRHDFVILPHVDKKSLLYNLAINSKSAVNSSDDAELVYSKLSRFEQFLKNKSNKLNQRTEAVNELLEQKIYSVIRAIQGSFKQDYFNETVFRLTNQSLNKKQCDRVIRDIYGLQSPHIRDLALLQKYSRSIRQKIQQAFQSFIDSLDQVIERFSSKIRQCNLFGQQACLKSFEQIMARQNLIKNRQLPKGKIEKNSGFIKLKVPLSREKAQDKKASLQESTTWAPVQLSQWDWATCPFVTKDQLKKQWQRLKCPISSQFPKDPIGMKCCGGYRLAEKSLLEPYLKKNKKCPICEMKNCYDDPIIYHSPYIKSVKEEIQIIRKSVQISISQKNGRPLKEYTEVVDAYFGMGYSEKYLSQGRSKRIRTQND